MVWTAEELIALLLLQHLYGNPRSQDSLKINIDTAYFYDSEGNGRGVAGAVLGSSDGLVHGGSTAALEGKGCRPC